MACSGCRHGLERNIHHATAYESGPQTNTVIVSAARTVESPVRYLESLSEYSFHNWANRSCEPASTFQFNTKYPSKNICNVPPIVFSHRIPSPSNINAHIEWTISLLFFREHQYGAHIVPYQSKSCSREWSIWLRIAKWSSGRCSRCPHSSKARDASGSRDEQVVFELLASCFETSPSCIIRCAALRYFPLLFEHPADSQWLKVWNSSETRPKRRCNHLCQSR